MHVDRAESEALNQLAEEIIKGAGDKG